MRVIISHSRAHSARTVKNSLDESGAAAEIRFLSSTVLSLFGEAATMCLTLVDGEGFPELLVLLNQT